MTTVKVGDNMLIKYCLGEDRISRVTEVYKRHFVCGGYKWRTDESMDMIGAGKWSTMSIRPATPEDIAAVAARRRRREVVSHEWRKDDQAIIDAVHAIITATAPRQAPNTVISGLRATPTPAP
jgi:hypothetical protein